MPGMAWMGLCKPRADAAVDKTAEVVGGSSSPGVSPCRKGNTYEYRHRRGSYGHDAAGGAVGKKTRGYRCSTAESSRVRNGGHVPFAPHGTTRHRRLFLQCRLKELISRKPGEVFNRPEQWLTDAVWAQAKRRVLAYGWLHIELVKINAA